MKITLAFMALVLSLYVTKNVYADTDTYGKYKVLFDVNCGLVLNERGWFKNTEHRVIVRYGAWYWDSSGEWAKLAVPYVSKYNDEWDLVLDRPAQIYRRNKDHTTEEPLKCVDGSWHLLVTGVGWIDIDDFEE